MSSYYDNNPCTSANSQHLIPANDAEQHFPSEGLYLGYLTGGSVELPALYDLSAGKGLCLLYKDINGREAVNRLLERLAWRVALTVPSHLCDIIFYNGGNPGDAFNAHMRINKFLFDNRTDRVYFDGRADEFRLLMNEVYASIVDRMSTIRLAGKKDLVELNESLGKDARLKYQFIILTDFPRHIRTELAQRLSQIIEAGPKAGIYVMMSWDMAADFADASSATSFNAQQMLANMQMLVPAGDGFQFRNSGYDEAFNRFSYVMDSTTPDMTEIESLLQKIDIYAETAKKAAKPSILKQDFDSLEKNAYEPVMSEINVTVGLDVHDKHPVTVRFNSGDYIHGFILGQSGSVVGYKYFNFKAFGKNDKATLAMRIIPQGIDGTISVRLGSPEGTEIGTFRINKDMPQKETEIHAEVTRLADKKGKQPLFFVFSSPTPSKSICTIHDFVFKK